MAEIFSPRSASKADGPCVFGKRADTNKLILTVKGLRWGAARFESWSP